MAAIWKDTWAVVCALFWDISRSYGALGSDKALCLSPNAGHATSSNRWRSNGVIQETQHHCFSSKGKEDRKLIYQLKDFHQYASITEIDWKKRSLWNLDVKGLDTNICSPTYILEAGCVYSGEMCNNCSSMYSINNGIKKMYVINSYFYMIIIIYL